jgi:nucleoside-diphosphate-sugar epimerase
MKTALTGASGFVGKAVVARLREVGFDFLPINRTRRDVPEEIVIGDLSTAVVDPVLLDGVDAIVHLAALTHSPGNSGDTIERYRAVNVAGTVTLLEAAIAAGVRRFVFVSSIKAVAERSRGGRPITSATPPAPEGAYGISKLEAEREVMARCQAAGMEWVIIRPPLVYGSEAKGNLAKLSALAGRGIPLPLRSIRNRRSILHVGNLADAIVAALTAQGANHRILTLCDTTLSTPELLRHLAFTHRRHVRLFPFPVGLMSLAGRILGVGAQVERLCGSLELDASESLTALGWTFRYKFHEAVQGVGGNSY